jgi:hypothetical protein
MLTMQRRRLPMSSHVELKTLQIGEIGGHEELHRARCGRSRERRVCVGWTRYLDGLGKWVGKAPGGDKGMPDLVIGTLLHDLQYQPWYPISRQRPTHICKSSSSHNCHEQLDKLDPSVSHLDRAIPLAIDDIGIRREIVLLIITHERVKELLALFRHLWTSSWRCRRTRWSWRGGRYRCGWNDRLRSRRGRRSEGGLRQLFLWQRLWRSHLGLLLLKLRRAGTLLQQIFPLLWGQ